MICRTVVLTFAFLYASALALLGLGTFGVFGVETDPLAGIYVVVLGLPWILFVDAPEALGPWLAVLAPGVNLALLLIVCSLTRRRRRPR